jgi:hypothetical protein
MSYIRFKKKKGNCIGHILRRNCLASRVIGGKTEGRFDVTSGRGRRRKQLVDNLKEKRGYCKLKQEAPYSTVWRTHFGRGCGSIVRERTQCIVMAVNICIMGLCSVEGRYGLRVKSDGTRAETKFRLSTKRMSPFKSTETSVQSTTGSRGVCMSGSNAGYTMFRGSVKSTGYPLHSPVSPLLPPSPRASPCAITFKLDFTSNLQMELVCSRILLYLFGTR